ncbi:MAG: hypothetical protein SOZ52_05800 [Pyramidobacter sp.]|nr:hypothetical protein [Pyramidobacter sp.]
MHNGYGTHAAAAVSLRDGCAYYAELVRYEGHYGLENADILPLPDGLMENGRIANPDALGAFLRRSLAFRWQKMPFIVGIPSSECIFKLLTLPYMGRDEIKPALYWNFSDYFAYRVEDVLFDAAPAALPSPPQGKINVMAAVSQRKKLMPVLNALTNRRSCISAVEPQIVACARALAPDESEKENLTVLTVFFKTEAHIVLFYQDCGILFRTVSLRDSGETENGNWLTVISEEISKTIEYAVHTLGFDRAAKIYAAGAGEFADQLCQRGGFGAEVSRRTFSSGRIADFSFPSDSSWYDVAGLLMRFIHED